MHEGDSRANRHRSTRSNFEKPSKLPEGTGYQKKKGRTAFLADKTTKLDITQNGKSIFPTLKHRHMTDNPIIIGRYDRLGTRSHLELRTRLVWARKQDLRENKTLEFWHSD